MQSQPIAFLSHSPLYSPTLSPNSSSSSIMMSPPPHTFMPCIQTPPLSPSNTTTAFSPSLYHPNYMHPAYMMQQVQQMYTSPYSSPKSPSLVMTPNMFPISQQQQQYTYSPIVEQCPSMEQEELPSVPRRVKRTLFEEDGSLSEVPVAPISTSKTESPWTKAANSNPIQTNGSSNFSPPRPWNHYHSFPNIVNHDDTCMYTNTTHHQQQQQQQQQQHSMVVGQSLFDRPIETSFQQLSLQQQQEEESVPLKQTKNWCDAFVPKPKNKPSTTVSSTTYHPTATASTATTTASTAITTASTAPNSNNCEKVESNECKLIRKELKDTYCNQFKEAEEYVTTMIPTLQSSFHYKVYSDLADIAKRCSHLKEARNYYYQVHALEPNAIQSWLDHVKLEEEQGNWNQCEEILNMALVHPQCKYNDSIIVKYIKLMEQRGNLESARSVLGRLQQLGIEKSWKIILEGAMMESRAGNVHLSRKIFQYLMQQVPKHGPIFYEAYRLEEKCEEYGKAMQVIDWGLQENPRYGPLWFASFHVLEKLAYQQSKHTIAVDLSPVRHYIKQSTLENHISKELYWKVYFEAAQMEERANHFYEARQYYAKSVLHAMPNLQWKVWLAGARLELQCNKMDVAKDLLAQALKHVPIKSKAVVLIECARLEEYNNNLHGARMYLDRAKQEAQHEWKVFLESILLEMRAGDVKRAIQEAKTALVIHPGTGRLWAILIQLKHVEGEKEQCKVFYEAYKQVPKSGEVWCEGARIHMNPLSSQFNLEKAKTCLDYALKFTPQYGDSLIENLRLDLLKSGPKMDMQDELKYLEQLSMNADPNYGPLWTYCKQHPLDSTRQVLKRAKELIMKELMQYRHIYQTAIMRSNSQVVVEEAEEEVFPSTFHKKSHSNSSCMSATTTTSDCDISVEDVNFLEEHDALLEEDSSSTSSSSTSSSTSHHSGTDWNDFNFAEEYTAQLEAESGLQRRDFITALRPLSKILNTTSKCKCLQDGMIKCNHHMTSLKDVEMKKKLIFSDLNFV